MALVSTCTSPMHGIRLGMEHARLELRGSAWWHSHAPSAPFRMHDFCVRSTPVEDLADGCNIYVHASWASILSSTVLGMKLIP